METLQDAAFLAEMQVLSQVEDVSSYNHKP